VKLFKKRILYRIAKEKTDDLYTTPRMGANYKELVQARKDVLRES
jgi:hypothetical protein